MQDLHILPKIRDSWSYLYVEHCKIEQEAKAIAIHDAVGTVPVPCAALTLLMLGPGTTISHAAVRSLAQSGCLVLWTGEEGVRFYAQGIGETRSAHNLARQARLWADQQARLAVVIRMYEMRFGEALDPSLTLQQIRGKEGVRVREAYAQASRETGIPWRGRSYRRAQWQASDPVNRALSCANSCLYGICHAAIVALGYSPGLGFIHTGKMLSFVYDIADLYKADLTIPLAFHVVREGTEKLESRVRRACRDAFQRERLLQRIVQDLDTIFAISDDQIRDSAAKFDTDAALPGGLWDPDVGEVEGGKNRAEET